MKKIKIEKVITLVLLLIGSIICLIPFWWLIRSSLMDNVEIFEFPPKILPKHFLWQNYVEALSSAPFDLYLKNTLTILIPVVIGILITSSMCAYGFARLRFPLRDFWFILVIGSMMLPSAVTLIPQFVMWKSLGLIGTFAPLIAPAWFGGGAFNIFLLRQFFKTIPREIDEAAIIDGANHIQIFTIIMIPLVKPALITVGLFAFMGVWNDFFNPLIYLNNQKSFTLALGLTQMIGTYSTKWNLLMAASASILIPCIIAFFIGQKHFIEGITLTGIKG